MYIACVISVYNLSISLVTLIYKKRSSTHVYFCTLTIYKIADWKKVLNWNMVSSEHYSYTGWHLLFEF